MNEEIEYAEMLEIPVSTVNVVHKKRRKKNPEPPVEPSLPELKESVIATVNDRLEENAETQANGEGNLEFDPVPDRIDTVRLYDTGEDGETLRPYDYPLNEGGKYALKDKKSRAMKIALGVEFGLACALCCGIFVTNVFMPSSAINTFFRAIHTPVEPTASRPYTDFTLTPVVSELSDAKLTLSPAGILSFTDECCVYPTADGTVKEVTRTEEGFFVLKIQHSDTFTGVISGLETVYYEVGDEVKSNVPVGFSGGENEVQVTMYDGDVLLNCFELTEENCLAWISDDGLEK